MVNKHKFTYSKSNIPHYNVSQNASGHQIVPESALRELYTSINALPGSNQIIRPTFPVEDTEFTYGMGFRSGTYRGEWCEQPDLSCLLLSACCTGYTEVDSIMFHDWT